MNRSLILLLVLIPAACGDDGEQRLSRDVPAAAAVVAPGMERQSLADQLRAMEVELRAAQEGDPDRVLTAEAISDQLISAVRPVDWLAGGYDVEARLRQLQALADRVVAQLRRGASVGQVEEEVAILREAVRDLQERLAVPGGGAAPLPLDSLLEQDPLRDVQAASLRGVRAEADSLDAQRELPDLSPSVEPVQSRPLGSPLPPGGG
jgi:hypothetical protein